MRSYELVMIVRPDLDEEATRAVIEKAKNVIVQNGGQIEKEDIWGKRRLAYEIKHHKDGFYAVLNFKGAPAAEQELDRVLKLSDDVIRHMIVRTDED